MSDICQEIRWTRNAIGRHYVVCSCQLEAGHDGAHWNTDVPHGWTYMAPFPVDEMLPGQTVTRKDDPAHKLLADDYTSQPRVYSADCYICEDPEFAAMGLPLCRPCPSCRENGSGEGHITADDQVCDECGCDEEEAWLAERDRRAD